MMTEDQVCEIIKANVSEAWDQSGAYETLADCIDSYAQNASDTVSELGGTMEQQSNASIAVYDLATKTISNTNCPEFVINDGCISLK